MNALSRIAALALFAAVSTPTAAQSQENLSLKWTVQQREDGKLSPVLHIMRLDCRSARCALQTVTINRCWELTGEKRSTNIVVESLSTEDDELKVEFKRDTVLLRYDWMGASFTHRLRWQRNVLGTPVLVSHEGAMVKDSAILGRLLTIELVAIHAAQPSANLAYRTLDCPLQVPAVPASQPRQ